MIKKIAHIIIGWGKAFGILPITTSEAKLSALRLKICGQCDYSLKSKVLEILNGHAQYEHILKCSKCTCPCLEKSLVTDEKCPADKW